MSIVNVLIGSGKYSKVERVAIECPFCHSKMTPDYLFLHETRLFAVCSNSSCGRHMILYQGYRTGFDKVDSNALPLMRAFSNTIKDISPSFISIYNQAFYAEQFSLDQVCGVGYRKALEFLIKDYLLHGIEDEAKKNSIRDKFLGKCIEDDVSDNRIKEVAKRAVWLGNDETHYTRRWADKDVSNLKHLIDLTLRWIENEVETKALLAEMP